jgi:hypothetical protein
MTQSDAIAIDVSYLFKSELYSDEQKSSSPEQYSLNRQLQYRLCRAFQRLESYKGAINSIFFMCSQK